MGDKHGCGQTCRVPARTDLSVKGGIKGEHVRAGGGYVEQQLVCGISELIYAQ